MNKTLILTAAATLALALMSGSAFAKTYEAAFTVNIHATASKSSKIVDKLFEGEHVKVQECNDYDMCLINHEGPDGWVPLASLESIGGGEGAPQIIIQGGFQLPHHKDPGGNGGIIVDPGPHKPPFGSIIGTVGNLPVSANPGTGGGGSGGNTGGGNVHPVGPIVTGGGNINICDIKPYLCQPGNGTNPGGTGPKGLGGLGTGGLHF